METSCGPRLCDSHLAWSEFTSTGWTNSRLPYCLARDITASVAWGQVTLPSSDRKRSGESCWCKLKLKPPPPQHHRAQSSPAPAMSHLPGRRSLGFVQHLRLEAAQGRPVGGPLRALLQRLVPGHVLQVPRQAVAEEQQIPNSVTLCSPASD